MSTKAKHEKLTEAQAAKLPGFHAEWLQIGRSTDRADRQKAEAAIVAMRVEIGITRRPMFIWCQSPATSLLALHVIRSPEWKKIAKQGLGDSLGASLWDSLGADLSSAWWGQHDSYWVAFYLFCRDIPGVKYDAKRSRQFDMWRDIAQSCCWWWPYENYVIVSERPTVVAMDERNVLHSVAFSDGWQVHSWRGIRVPRAWIEDRANLDPGVALTDPSVERRRAAAVPAPGAGEGGELTFAEACSARRGGKSVEMSRGDAQPWNEWAATLRPDKSYFSFGDVIYLSGCRYRLKPPAPRPRVAEMVATWAREPSSEAEGGFYTTRDELEELCERVVKETLEAVLGELPKGEGKYVADVVAALDRAEAAMLGERK